MLVAYLDHHILRSIHKEKKRPFATILILVISIFLAVWSLHSFAAKSIENAMWSEVSED